MSGSTDRQSDMGLCANCDDRLICKFHQPGKQVLFCEEYKLPLRGDERIPNQEQNFSTPIDFGVKL